jgi:hypothetical protein
LGAVISGKGKVVNRVLYVQYANAGVAFGVEIKHSAQQYRFHADPNLYKPLRSFSPGNLWGPGLTIRDTVVATVNYAAAKFLEIFEILPTKAAATVVTAGARRCLK